MTSKDFEIVPALSDALRDEVYRIRHQVYCEELGFELPRSDRRECDEYDVHSLHVLVRDARGGAYIGCARLVLARPENPHYPLPFEKVCSTTLDRSIVDPAKLPRSRIGEFSRLAILPQFRKRRIDAKHAECRAPHPAPRVSITFPHALAGLYLGTIALARLNGIETVFVLTEQRLLRQLRILGVKVQTIGSSVEYRGQRLPSMMSANGVIDDLNLFVRSYFATIAAEIAQKYALSAAPQH